MRARELVIEQMKKRFGQSSERSAVLEQLELRLADMEEDTAQAEAAAQMATTAAASANVKVQAFERRKPARRPLPKHLPRERVVYPSPTACPCSGGALHKLGEDVTETLELIPRQWKVIQHVREKYVPNLLGDHATAGALASDCTRARRAFAAGAHPVLKVRAASAAQPPEQGLRARGDRARFRRSPIGFGSDTDAAGRGHQGSSICGRTHPRRRYDRAGAGKGQDA